MFIPISKAREGEVVTTKTEHGGTGLGYLVNSRVYVSTGNGFAVEGNKNFPKVLGYEQDSGAGYRAKVNSLVGW